MVEKLGLKTLKLRAPYRIQDDYGEFTVTEQVLIAFSIGKYCDEILCDVLPMKSCHILLGRPWKFKRKAKYDECKDCYSLVFNQKRLNLVPLDPWEAIEDQIRIARQYKEKESENTSVIEEKSDENTLGSDERKELECETQTLEGDIDKKSEDVSVSTNDISFPSEAVSLLQESNDVFSQEAPEGIRHQSEILSYKLEVSKNQDSRTNLFEEGENDVILEVFILEPIKIKISNPFQVFGDSLTGVPRIKTRVKRAKDANKIVWDTKD